jgi:hypothetical protein
LKILRRDRSDDISNSTSDRIIYNSSFIQRETRDFYVGNFILVLKYVFYFINYSVCNDEEIPVDLFLLISSEVNIIVNIDDSNLDCETSLEDTSSHQTPSFMHREISFC